MAFNPPQGITVWNCPLSGGGAWGNPGDWVLGSTEQVSAMSHTAVGICVNQGYHVLTQRVFIPRNGFPAGHSTPAYHWSNGPSPSSPV